MDDGIEHGVVVIVLGHFFVADVGLLIAEIDRHAVRAVEGWVVVVEDSVSDHKGDVASFDGSSLSILSSDAGGVLWPWLVCDVPCAFGSGTRSGAWPSRVYLVGRTFCTPQLGVGCAGVVSFGV